MAVGGFFISMNLAVVWQWLAFRKHHSFAPFVGGTLATLGFLTLGPPLRIWWYVPLLIDPSCAYSVAAAILSSFIHKRRGTTRG